MATPWSAKFAANLTFASFTCHFKKEYMGSK